MILSRDMQDRGVCPQIFVPALVPGQKDTGTRKFLCPGTKGHRDVPFRGNASSDAMYILHGDIETLVIKRPLLALLLLHNHVHGTEIFLYCNVF